MGIRVEGKVAYEGSLLTHDGLTRFLTMFFNFNFLRGSLVGSLPLFLFGLARLVFRSPSALVRRRNTPKQPSKPTTVIALGGGE